MAGLLAANRRTATAVGLGATLNLQLILAGAIEPSVFFVVAGLAIVIWSLETTAGPATLDRLARIATVIGVAAAAFLVPAIRGSTGMFDDPALVLIVLITLHGRRAVVGGSKGANRQRHAGRPDRRREPRSSRSAR